MKHTYWHHITPFSSDDPVEPKCIEVTSDVEVRQDYGGSFTVSPVDRSLDKDYEYKKFYIKSGGEVGGNNIPYMSYIRDHKMNEDEYAKYLKEWQDFKANEEREDAIQKDIEKRHSYVDFLVGLIAEEQPKNEDDNSILIECGIQKGEEYRLAKSLKKHLNEFQFKQLVKYMVNLL